MTPKGDACRYIALFSAGILPKNTYPEGTSSLGMYESPTETGLYYLMSRYYDPEMGRFINADILISTGQGLIGNNTYCYCNNSPLSRKDDGGKTPDTVFDIISLGASIVEVVANPADPWSWIGLVGDIVDVAVPFVGGLGEATKALKTLSKTLDIGDDIADATILTNKTLEVVKESAEKLNKGVNSVYVSFKDGLLEYVGITNNFLRRKNEWKGVRDIIELVPNLDRGSARLVEQTVIATFGKMGKGCLSNIRNSIGTKGTLFNSYKEFFLGLLD